jgi:hypothetical protein
MANKYIYAKGQHFVKVLEVDDKACIEGLGGWLDSIELAYMLVGNGYQLAR